MKLTKVSMDKRLVVHVPAALAVRVNGCAASRMTTASEYTRQALLAAIAEDDELRREHEAALT